MRRGTTPTHIFTLSQDPAMFKNFIITYQQKDTIILEKQKSDCEIVDKTVTVTLAQDETLQFKAGSSVSIQIKALANNGAVFATKIKSIPVEEILNEEVMV